jgi:hypothetical protein
MGNQRTRVTPHQIPLIGLVVFKNGKITAKQIGALPKPGILALLDK